MLFLLSTLEPIVRSSRDRRILRGNSLQDSMLLFERRRKACRSLVYAWLIYALKAFGCSFRTTANAVLRACTLLIVACKTRSVSFAYLFLWSLQHPWNISGIAYVLSNNGKKAKKKTRANIMLRVCGETRGPARSVSFPLNATILCFCTKVVASNFALNK